MSRPALPEYFIYLLVKYIFRFTYFYFFVWNQQLGSWARVELKGLPKYLPTIPFSMRPRISNLFAKCALTRQLLSRAGSQQKPPEQTTAHI